MTTITSGPVAAPRERLARRRLAEPARDGATGPPGLEPVRDAATGSPTLMPDSPVVLAVDGRPLLRSGLAGIARRAFGGAAVALGDLEQAAAMLRFIPRGPRALLLGLRPGDDPGQLVAAARQLSPIVVCVLDRSDAVLIRAALATQADGYMLTEDAGPDALRDTLLAVEGGERVVPSKLATQRAGGADAAAITARCHEVLRSLADGLHDHEIAAELGISTSSVRKHVANAQLRLRARTRTQAVAVAAREGLL